MILAVCGCFALLGDLVGWWRVDCFLVFVLAGDGVLLWFLVLCGVGII